jgi:hypothetical protein
MRLLKPFLITLLGLSLVLLAVSALLPGRVMTSRWVMVHAGKDTVLQAIRDISSWPEWNLLMNGADGPEPARTSYAAGDRVSWKSVNGTKQVMTIDDMNGNGLATTLQLGDERPFRSGFSVEKRQADSVQVVWFLIEELKWYPWEKVYGMMASDIKGPLMQKSLDRLKARLER